MPEDDTLLPMAPPTRGPIRIPPLPGGVTLPREPASETIIDTGQKRGRPAGSRNRNPKTNDNGLTKEEQELKDRKERDALKVKREKDERADKYAEWIRDELNDQLFMFLIARIPDLQASDLYTEGKIPLKAKPNPNFTPMGNSIAIPTDVASSWGKLLAELSYTPAGKSVSGMAENNMLSVGFAAVTALYSTYRYSQQLKPFIEMVNRASEIQQQHQQQRENDEQ